jgi:hypothetical protein
MNRHNSGLRIRGCLIVSFALLASACGGGGSGDSGNGGQNPPPSNNPPVFGLTTYTMSEDGHLASRFAISDPENDTLTFVQTSNPAMGTVDSFTADGTFSYRPAADASGTVTFGVRATDSKGASTNATVTITVLPVNDAPRASALSINIAEDTAVTQSVSVDDVEGDALTFSLGAPPTSGTITNIAANGAFSYQPQPDFFGTDQFELLVADAGGATTSIVVSVEVTPVDDGPVSASNDTLQVNEAGLAAIAVLQNDRNPDREAITLTIEEQAFVGTASVNTDNTVRIAGLPSGFRGLTRFKYRLTESGGAFSVATAAVFVDTEPFRVAFVGIDAASGFREVFMTDFTGPPVKMTQAADGIKQFRTFTASADGSTLVYRRSVSAGVEELSYLRTSDPVDQVRVALPGGARLIFSSFDQFIVSGDGLWIALIGIGPAPANAEAVYLLHVNDPAGVRSVSTAVAPYVLEMKFSPDSRYLYFLGSEGAVDSEGLISGKSLYRVALDASNSSTAAELVSRDPASGPAADDVDEYTIAADGSSVLLTATRNGMSGVYSVDTANLRSETRVSHDLSSGQIVNGPPSWLPDGSRIRYSVSTDDYSPLGTYLADPGSSSSPRQLVAGTYTSSFRPDSRAVLYTRETAGVSELFEMTLDAAQPDVKVAEAQEGFYDSTGNMVATFGYAFQDPVAETGFFYVIRSSHREQFGTSRQFGTAGQVSRYFNVSGVGRGVMLLGESAGSVPLPVTMRLALFNAWVPDRPLYLGDAPIAVSGGRALALPSR